MVRLTDQKCVRVLTGGMVLIALWSSCAGCIRRTDISQGGKKLTEITYAYWGGPNEVLLAESILDKFEKLNPDIKVKRLHIASDYNPKLQTMMAADRAPDVFYVLAQDCRDYMRKGALKDMTPFLNTSKTIRYEDFFPETVAQFKDDKKIYALSWDWSPCVVFYNKTFFDQAKIPCPKDGWTWDDFLKAAKALTVRDNLGRTTRYGTLHLPWWVWYQWIAQNGGSTFNETLDQCTLDSSEAAQALQFECDLTLKHHIAPMPDDPTADSTAYFMAGKTAMVFSYRYFITFLDQLKRYEWGVAPCPRGKVRVNMPGAAGLAISANTKNAKAAWRLIEYMCGPQGQAEYVKFRWGVPTLKSLAKQVDRFEDPAHPNWNYRLFINELNYTKVAPSSPYIPDAQFLDICIRQRERMFLGQQTPKEALAQMAQQTNKIIQENKKAEAAQHDAR